MHLKPDDCDAIMPSMLVFVDASGDPGLKILNKSSLYFIVALVTLDEEDALVCDRRITQLRNDLKIPPGFEFHFSDNSARIREEFLKAVAPCRFFYHIYALNKDPDVLERLCLDRREGLFNYVIARTCENARQYLSNAKVTIDGQKGDRRFRDDLAAYLRREVRERQGKGLIRSVSIQRSSGNNLLQLADYVAGVNNRMLCRKSGGTVLHGKYLAKHEVTVQMLPEK